MTVTQIAYPVAPAVERLRGTLLDAATVTNDFKWLDGGDLFLSWNGLQFAARAGICTPTDKQLDQTSTWVDGFRFAAYGGITCKLTDMDEQESGAMGAFLKGESIAVEKALMELRFAENAAAGTDEPEDDMTALNIPYAWAAPVDVTPTPATAVSPGVGIGLLEEYAGSVYVGAPTIHVPRSIGSLLMRTDGLDYDGDVLRTTLGSKVAAGAGYAYPNLGPDGTEPADDERWLYATGEVFVGRSEAIARSAFNQETNEMVTLVERGYIVAVDTFVAAVLVNLES
jgi:hypothetical protein